MDSIRALSVCVADRADGGRDAVVGQVHRGTRQPRVRPAPTGTVSWVMPESTWRPGGWTTSAKRCTPPTATSVRRRETHGPRTQVPSASTRRRSTTRTPTSAPLSADARAADVEQSQQGGRRLPRAQGAKALRGRGMHGSADRSPIRRGRCCLLSHTPQAAAGPVMLRKRRRHRDGETAA